jgi:integrase
MKVELIATAEAPPDNVVALTIAPKPKSIHHRLRFTIQDYTNQATGSKSFRVSGYKRDGARVRDNFGDLKAAQCRQVELETEYLARETETAIRATKLTDTQLRLAETAYVRLDADNEILLAVDHWLKHGRQNAVAESPRLDDALKAFETWLETATLRERSKSNLRTRVNVFANSTGNLRVSDITPETIDTFLDGRSVSPASKDNDRRAVSRFFSWCMDRKRRWTAVNPCRAVKVDQGEKAPPAVLTVTDCKALLSKAESFKRGRLAPYVAVCLFAGLRPLEARRLTWEAVNLADGEIRLEATQTKTGTPRVVSICPTLAKWLKKYEGRTFNPPNWRKDFDAVKGALSFGTPTGEKDSPKAWPEDVLRHTAISHYFRHTGSYGQTAEQFGNSEAIIKKHYQGRVSSEDTKAFYALLPKKGGRK